MYKGRTGRRSGACAEPTRLTTLRGVIAALLGAVAGLAVAGAAVAAPAPPPPTPEAAETTVVALPEDTVPVSTPTDARAPLGTPGASVAAPGAGHVALVTWFEGVPTAWPVTATIVSAGVTFADGATSVDVVTDPTGEPVELSLIGVPADGARVRLQQPDRSDASFQDVVCESSGNWYDTEPIERGVELIVPRSVDGGGTSWGHWRPFPVCWFQSVAATRITLESRLDGGAPPADAVLAVLPESGRVGTGGAFDDDGIFPIGTNPLSIELPGLSADEPIDVFVGQGTVVGSTLYDMACIVGETKVDAPLESRTIGDRTVVGITIPVRLHADVSCTVDAANADLDAVKTASIDAAEPGSVFDYRIVATNAGRAPLFAVALTDAVPAELTVLAVSADEDSTVCTVDGNDVECTLGDLPAGAVRTVRITVSVHPDVVDASSITNVAIVRGEVPLWVPGLGAVQDPSEGLVSAGSQAGVRPPVFARAVQVLASNVVRAFAPTPAATTLPPVPTTLPPITNPATSAPADAPATTAPATTAPAITAAATPVPPAVSQQGPLPTVTGGTTLPTTGGDLSLLTAAGWTTATGAALVVVRRARRTVRR